MRRERDVFSTEVKRSAAILEGEKHAVAAYVLFT